MQVMANIAIEGALLFNVVVVNRPAISVAVYFCNNKTA